MQPSSPEQVYGASDACPDASQLPVRMSFGKHKGLTVDEVPYSYVVWLLFGTNTTDRFKIGNYTWIRENERALFHALKARMKREIDGL